MSFNIRILILKITHRSWSPCHAVHCRNCDRKLAEQHKGAVSPLLLLVFLQFL